jgi:hypothetical protein
MRMHMLALAAMSLAAALVPLQTVAQTPPAQTPIDVQPVKELHPTGTLSTCSYQPVAQEAPFLSQVSDKEKTNGGITEKYSIHRKTGIHIAWFGIVRGIAPPDGKDGTGTLLVQHKYFDGMTDCHIMLVQWTGGGDFLARLTVDPETIPALSLVRVYGIVTGEKEGVPEVHVDYIRLWPWMTFTFMDLSGNDHSNPRWSHYTTAAAAAHVYSPYPNENYYLGLLGDPAEFGLNLKP